jgi:hypothetical protein
MLSHILEFSSRNPSIVVGLFAVILLGAYRVIDSDWFRRKFSKGRKTKR